MDSYDIRLYTTCRRHRNHRHEGFELLSVTTYTGTGRVSHSGKRQFLGEQASGDVFDQVASDMQTMLASRNVEEPIVDFAKAEIAVDIAGIEGIPKCFVGQHYINT